MKPMHRGEQLAAELNTLQMCPAEFACKIDIPADRLMKVLTGQRPITGDIALRLECFFGTSAEFWLNLQSLYEIRLAQMKSPGDLDVPG